MARFVIIEGAVLHRGAPMPVESYHISDWGVNARLFLYCGTLTEQDLAAQVCLMMRGEPTSLLGALRATTCNMRLDEAERLGVPHRL